MHLDWEGYFRWGYGYRVCYNKSYINTEEVSKVEECDMMLILDEKHNKS